MIRIAICDDEKKIRDQLCEYLRRFFAEQPGEYELLQYSSANELLQSYPADLDLLLLDIYMSGMDGMSAARQIRTFDEQVCIVFITTMYQCAIDGYKVRAFGFIKKPVSYAELHHELNCAVRQIERTRSRQDYITLRSGGAVHRIPVAEIAYCEVRNHSVRVCSGGRVQEYRCPMKELEEQLAPYGFFRCHASYLVNSRAIQRIGASELLLKDGTQIPVSQRRRKEFLYELSNYIGEQI